MSYAPIAQDIRVGFQDFFIRATKPLVDDISGDVTTVGIDSTVTSLTYRRLIPAGTTWDYPGYTSEEEDAIIDARSKYINVKAGKNSISPRYRKLANKEDNSPIVSAQLIFNRSYNTRKYLAPAGEKTTTLEYIGSEASTSTGFEPEFPLLIIEYFRAMDEDEGPFWDAGKFGRLLDKAVLTLFQRGTIDAPPRRINNLHKPVPFVYNALAMLDADGCVRAGINRYSASWCVKLSAPTVLLNRTDW